MGSEFFSEMIMRVVHVNYNGNYEGGAAIAALRLHEALLAQGVDSIFVCRVKPEAEKARQWPSRRLHQSVRNALIKGQNAILKCLYGISLPVNIIPSGVAEYVNTLNPDIVHLHWIKADTMSIEEIRQIKAPIVWSLHDLWPMLGTESHPSSDWYKTGSFHRVKWIDRWVWDRKRKAFDSPMNIHLIGVSQWVTREAQSSIIFRNCSATYIPLCLEDVFLCRKTSKRKNEKYTLIFGAFAGSKNGIKGFDRLKKAFEHLNPAHKRFMQLLIFGEDSEDTVVSDIPVHFLGKIPLLQMPAVYKQGDVLVFPSLQETFGQTKLEALACGIPVIAFDATACAEGIIHKENGWIAESGNVIDFANGIEWGYHLWQNPEAMTRVVENLSRVMPAYSRSAVVGKVLEVYSKMGGR